MRDDVDALVGDLFRRLSLMRIELGEGALDRTLRELMKSLGASALAEAERRASALAARTGPHPRGVGATPRNLRRPVDVWEESSGDGF